MINFRIFLSSPGDCEAERQSVHQIAARLNADPLVNCFAHISVVAWDWGAGVPMDALVSPQISVNTHLPTPDQCDVFAGIFRSRFGSPIPANEFRKDDGSQFLSGSEYEFHRVWKARRHGASSPDIFMYRCQLEEGATCPDEQQGVLLENFFNGSPFKDAEQKIGSFSRFVDTNEFSIKLENDLRAVLSQKRPGTKLSFKAWLKQQASKMTSHAGPRYTKDAHVATDIGEVFDWLLARQPAVIEFDKNLADLYKNIPSTSEFSEYKLALERAAEHLRANVTWNTLPEFSSISSILNRLETLAWREQEKLEKLEKEKKGTSENEGSRYTSYQLRETANGARYKKLS